MIDYVDFGGGFGIFYVIDNELLLYFDVYVEVVKKYVCELDC